MTQTCALDGCRRLVPVTARLHGDLFCSSGCFQVAWGRKTAAEAVEERVASGRARRSAVNTIGGWRDQGHASWERAQRVAKP